VVNVPPNVMPVLLDHLERFTGPLRTAWLFPGDNGNPCRHGPSGAWTTARQSVGRSDLHLHDLRGSGLTWSATLGATTAELMYRAGHKSPVAALRYQHATQDRDAALADALGDLASGEIVQLRRTKDGRSSEAPPASFEQTGAEQVELAH